MDDVLAVAAARERDEAVLIVEDHAVVAFGTAEVIKRRHPRFRTEIASDARGAVQKLDERDWSWILLDLAIPGANGLSLVRAVHARGIAHRCCVVSASDSAATVEEVRHLGVAGYVKKSLPFDAFCDALDRVLMGHAVFPKVEERRFQSPVALTYRQVGILRHIQRGLSTKQIAFELGIAEGTVRNHTLAILRALGVNNRTHAVARGTELGLLTPTVPA
jgi:DNA-binding NarL/FixJ family response regulator